MKSILYLLLVTVSLGSFAQTTIKFDHSKIHYMGRVKYQPDAAELSWPGTTVSINFNGTGIKATLKDLNGLGYYDVIVDGVLKEKMKLDTAKRDYVLATGLTAGRHNVQLFKATEWAMGKSWFYGFTLDKGATLLPAPATKKRKIEFYGNSITCGYAVEDTTGKDRGTAPFENNYKSYAAITARHFDAEYYCIAKSGIGITVSWAPQVMPEMYDLLDATDPLSKWDFNQYTPDLVVVNLFQNDSWITKMPANEQFKARFGSTPPTPQFIIKAYKDFIGTIRGKYPKGADHLRLGSMDATKAGSPWPGYIEQAVAQLKDRKIYTHFFPYKNTGGHPSEKEQQAMADDLIAFIEKNIKW